MPVVRLLEDSMRETAKEHALEIDADRHNELIREKAILMIPEQRASYDAFAIEADDARDMTTEEEIEIDGGTYINRKLTPPLKPATG